MAMSMKFKKYNETLCCPSYGDLEDDEKGLQFACLFPTP